MYKSYLIVKWSIKHLICTSYALPVTPTHANDAWHCVKGTCLWLSATMGVQLLPVTRRRGPLLTHYKYNTYSTTQHITDTVPVQCTHRYTNEWEAIPIHVYVLYCMCVFPLFCDWVCMYMYLCVHVFIVWLLGYICDVHVGKVEIPTQLQVRLGRRNICYTLHTHSQSPQHMLMMPGIVWKAHVCPVVLNVSHDRHAAVTSYKEAWLTVNILQVHVHTVQHSTLHRHTVQDITIQYSTVQHILYTWSSVQYMLYSTLYLLHSTVQKIGRASCRERV